jgi:FtsP/CotA-like multicopper oxidase with cupredoxin domain
VATCYNSTKQSDGLDCGVTPFASAVINGKGQQSSILENKMIESTISGVVRTAPHYRSGVSDFPNWPLEEFVVEQGDEYRFRVACASMTYAFRLSIDGHTLRVVATDGSEVHPQPVQSVVVFGGERYDVLVTASRPSGNFWIRAETLEKYQNGEVLLSDRCMQMGSKTLFVSGNGAPWYAGHLKICRCPKSDPKDC